MPEQESGVPEEARTFRAHVEESPVEESVEQRLAREGAEHQRWVEHEAPEQWKSLQFLRGESTYYDTTVPADGGSDPEAIKGALVKREELLNARYAFLRKGNMPDLKSVQHPPELWDHKAWDSFRARVSEGLRATTRETSTIRTALTTGTVEALRKPFVSTLDNPRSAPPSRAEIVRDTKNAVEHMLYTEPQEKADFEHRTMGFASAALDKNDFQTAIDVLDAADLMRQSKDDLLKRLDRAEQRGLKIGEYRQRIEGLTSRQ